MSETSAEYIVNAPVRSYRERRRRMCDRKRRLNWFRAHAAVEAMRQRGQAVHAYVCNFCGQVHLGHSNREELA